MDKLINILKEVLREANLEKDVDKERIAKEYINKVNSLINEYTKNNKEISFTSLYGRNLVEIYLKDLDIKISNLYSKVEANFDPKPSDSKKPLIKVFKARIETEPKLSVKFDEEILKHELIHFLDYKKIKTDPQQLGNSLKNKTDKVQSNKAKYRNYINFPIEINAHFFELFMPQVMKVIEKKDELPNNVKDFISMIIKSDEAKDFYDQLKNDNKKRVLKRLGTYYDVLKNGGIENNGKIDDDKLEKVTDTFISRLKKKIGI